jgi:glycosyltransferase involved in cell wall biosynthesis
MEILYCRPPQNWGNQDSGYGFIADNFIKILEEYKYVNKTFTFKVLDKDYLLENKVYDKLIFLAHPNSFLLNREINANFKLLKEKAPQRFLHFFWETDRLPETWLPLLKSDLFTGFIASSNFVKELIEQENLNKPVFVVPPLWETKPVFSVEEKIKLSQFTVLFVGQYTKRKGLEDAIISFVRALGSFPECSLLIKYHELGDGLSLDAALNFLIKSNFEGNLKATVFSTKEFLSKEQMEELYNKSSLLLFPSRGEGFGLPVVEALSHRVPVICTGWSALKEFSHYPNVNLISRTLDQTVNMAHYSYGLTSNYALPHIGHTMELLQKQYLLWKENKQEYFSKVDEDISCLTKDFGRSKVLETFSEFLNSKN